MDNKLSELKYALECLEGAQYDGEWNSALVGGGGDGAEYPAVTNLAGVVVRTARLGPHEARLCEYLKSVSPSNIRALLADLEAKDNRIAELKQEPTIKHMRSVEESLICATDRVSELEARLATPVRLPGEMIVHDWEHRVERQAAFEHRKIAWDARLEEDKKAILTAGFTFTVEGDE
ncbi:TPA: hypothetical protein QIF01_004937 [Serratia marcescens]|nr:hypothetical protein [Serratia marcescens]